MRRISLAGLIAFGFGLGLALTIPRAQAENRPSETPMFQLLNGEVSRDLNLGEGSSGSADGGGLTLMTLDAGIGCNTVRTGTVYEMHCDSPVHFCAWGDGGCSTAIGSQNYGRPVNASTPAAPAPYYFISAPNSTAAARKQVCMTCATGDAQCICALFRMQ